MYACSANAECASEAHSETSSIGTRDQLGRHHPAWPPRQTPRDTAFDIQEETHQLHSIAAAALL